MASPSYEEEQERDPKPILSNPPEKDLEAADPSEGGIAYDRRSDDKTLDGAGEGESSGVDAPPTGSTSKGAGEGAIDGAGGERKLKPGQKWQEMEEHVIPKNKLWLVFTGWVVVVCFWPCLCGLVRI